MKWLLRMLTSNSKKEKKGSEVIKGVDEIARRVQEGIGCTSLEDLPYPPTIIQSCDIEIPQNRGIQEYLEYLAAMFTREIIVNEGLDNKLKKSKKFDSTDEAPSILITIAFLDIYALQIIGIHYGISEQKLKGIIYKIWYFETRNISKV